MDAVPGAAILLMDFLDPDAPAKLIEALGGEPDIVLSDMAAPTTGHRRTDHIRTMHLCEVAADFAISVLKPGGHFLAKTFQGGTEAELLDAAEAEFPLRPSRQAAGLARRIRRTLPCWPRTSRAGTGIRALDSCCGSSADGFVRSGAPKSPGRHPAPVAANSSERQRGDRPRSTRKAMGKLGAPIASPVNTRPQFQDCRRATATPSATVICWTTAAIAVAWLVCGGRRRRQRPARWTR